MKRERKSSLIPRLSPTNEWWSGNEASECLLGSKSSLASLLRSVSLSVTSLELSSSSLSDSSSGSREPAGVTTVVHMGAGAWWERRGRMGLRGTLGGCTLARGEEV